MPLSQYTLFFYKALKEANYRSRRCQQGFLARSVRFAFRRKRVSERCVAQRSLVISGWIMFRTRVIIFEEKYGANLVVLLEMGRQRTYHGDDCKCSTVRTTVRMTFGDLPFGDVSTQPERRKMSESRSHVCVLCALVQRTQAICAKVWCRVWQWKPTRLWPATCGPSWQQ